jgi:hypothetical protein
MPPYAIFDAIFCTARSKNSFFFMMQITGPFLSILKVSKNQNDFMKTSFLPKTNKEFLPIGQKS